MSKQNRDRGNTVMLSHVDVRSVDVGLTRGTRWSSLRLLLLPSSFCRFPLYQLLNQFRLLLA